MADGVQTGPIQILAPAGSGSLVDATMLPPDGALAPASATTAGQSGGFSAPTPAAGSEAAAAAQGYDLAWFERIHILPRQRDLGAVVSAQSIQIEVYNAFRNRARVLSEIVISGPDGVEVTDPADPPPLHFAAQQARVFTIEVAAGGDVTLDNLVTWVFEEVDATGTTLGLIGFRLIPMPWSPNWAQDLVEELGYLTDIIVSRRGDEQRIQLRAVPVGTITYAAMFNEVRDAQMASATLYGNLHRAWGVARWQFEATLTAAAAADTIMLEGDFALLPFEVGGLVLLWASPYQWEVQSLAAVADSELELATSLRNLWPAGTKVLPMVIGRLSNDQPYVWESLKVGSQLLTFDIDGFKP